MQNKSLLSVDDLNTADIERIFNHTQLFKDEFNKTGRFIHCIRQEQISGLVAQLLFVQPSTRTRSSFELACGRLGMATASLWNLHFSSMTKGETLEDTISCLIALKPSVIILRCGSEASNFLRNSPVPIINAGLGVEEHPTQALVDAFTIRQFNSKVKGVKVLIVGDVLHSRVANSNLKLLMRLGADLGYCAPKALSPRENKAWEAVKRFESLDSGIPWADVIMCLRVQKEHHDLRSFGFSMAEYRDKYYIGYDRMKDFKKAGILLHPGPALRGVEIDSKVLNDSRCHIMTQVENSAYIRAAVICHVLNIDVRN